MALTGEQINYIIKLNELTHKSTIDTVEKFEERYGFKVSIGTVIRRWKKSGLELQVKGGRRTKSRKAYNHSPLYHLSVNPDPYAKYQRSRGRHI